MTGLGVRTKFFILANEPLRCSVNIMISGCMNAVNWERDGSGSGVEWKMMGDKKPGLSSVCRLWGNGKA